MTFELDSPQYFNPTPSERDTNSPCSKHCEGKSISLKQRVLGQSLPANIVRTSPRLSDRGLCWVKHSGQVHISQC